MTINSWDYFTERNPYVPNAHRRRHAIRRPKRSDEPARRRAAYRRWALNGAVVAVVCGMVVVIGWVG